MGAFAKLVCFTIGFYAGAYFDQNYELPRLPDPANIPSWIEDYLKRRKKE
uniref:Exosortase system-associated protein, TIGR04073 family n=1 Tax=Strongyloides venezuelensis TaxID=75913 RepID=A0A0K0ETX8_STRVS